MNIIKSFDGRNIRVKIVLDECPEHPFNMTDAPITVWNDSTKQCFWRNHEKQGLPYRDPSTMIVYFNSEVCRIDSREHAEGALSINVQAWKDYCGWNTPEQSRQDAKKSLGYCLEELKAWVNGDVYGYLAIKNFVKAGHTYESVDTDSCFGFYGKPGLVGIADHMPTKALTRAVRSWAKRY